MILFVPGMAGVYVASALCGVSLSCFMAMTSYLISVSVEKEAVAKASGMFSIIGGIGGLVAPIVLGNVATYVLGGNHPVNQFTIAFVGMLMFGIVVTISGRKMKGEKSMKQYGFGVDIGGTTCKIGLFDMNGTILEKWEINTNTENHGAAILDDVASCSARQAGAEKTTAKQKYRESAWSAGTGRT